jgi:hypothetical protein
MMRMPVPVALKQAMLETVAVVLTGIVTVYPLARVTVSPLPGTPEGDHVAEEFQFPDAADVYAVPHANDGQSRARMIQSFFIT